MLHSFTRETDGTVTDGAFPEAGLIFDSNGARYGTTSTGGSSKNDGTVFKLTPPAAGQPHPRDVWYSQQIAKMDIANGRSAETIRKHMKK